MGAVRSPSRAVEGEILPAPEGKARSRHKGGLRWLVVLGVVLMVAVAASLAIGNRFVPTAAVLDALLRPDTANPDHLVVRELRIPRTVLGLLAGAGFSVAGVLMQAITRNPLAEPGLLGVNAGAGLAVVAGSWVLDRAGMGPLVWLGLLGAVVASLLVWALGSVGRGKPTSVRLVLAGAAVAALMFSLIRAITLIDRATLEQYRFWVAGSLSGRDLETATVVAPFIVIGMLVAFLVAGSLNLLALGEESARALGSRIGLTRMVAGGGIVILAGAAVAAVGPIIFVGLVVPHAVRSLTGPDHRWLVPSSALAGAALLLFSDVIGRVVVHPSELQAGIVMAAVGGPVFILIVRRMRGEYL